MTHQVDPQEQAAILMQALPHMLRYDDAIVVVKYGGHAMGDEAVAREFARDMVLLEQSGVNPVVVHGGGPQIGAMLSKLGIKSEFAAGLRITDKATVELTSPVAGVVTALHGEPGVMSPVGSALVEFEVEGAGNSESEDQNPSVSAQERGSTSPSASADGEETDDTASAPDVSGEGGPRSGGGALGGRTGSWRQLRLQAPRRGRRHG